VLDVGLHLVSAAERRALHRRGGRMRPPLHKIVAVYSKTKALAEAGAWLCRYELEAENGRELDTARAATADEGIADAHVAGSGNRIAARSA